MKEFKGTPGPWKTDERYEDSTEIIDSKGFSHVTADVCAILLGWDEHFQHWSDSKEAYRDISREEQRANANLIAAAPELLEALQFIINDCSRMIPKCAEGKAIAAINKALGE